MPVVLAHGIGTRGDLPLPIWLFAYGAGIALVISFVLLRLLWHRPRLDVAAAGSPAPGWADAAVGVLSVATRVFGVISFAAILIAAAIGSEETTDNLAPVAVYVLFWVGLQLLSPLVGDIWRALSPWDTIAMVARRLRGHHDVGVPEPMQGATCWPAAAGLAAFVWLELCFHDPASPRVLAVALGAYAVVMLACAACFGRAWLRTGDGFAQWFGLLSAIAPVHLVGGGIEAHGAGWGSDSPRTAPGRGRLRLRWPGAGLADVVVRPGTAAVVLVVLGATAFDGVTRTSFWGDIVAGRTGWALTGFATAGLVWVVGIVAIAYVGAMRAGATLTSRPKAALLGPFVHSLVPIALAYAVAHYFSLAVFEG